MPNLVDVSRTAELFATFTNNPVVVCFVGAIFAVYVMVVVWARRKDIQDSAKVILSQDFHHIISLNLRKARPFGRLRLCCSHT